MKNEIAWERFDDLDEINLWLSKNSIKASDVINISYGRNEGIMLFYIKKLNSLDI